MNDEQPDHHFEGEESRGIENSVNEVKKNLGQPLMVDPRRSLSGVGVWVDGRYRAVCPDQLSIFDVAPKIGVSIKNGKRVDAKHVSQRPDEDWVIIFSRRIGGG